MEFRRKRCDTGRDANERQNRKVYMTRAGAKNAKMGTFLHTNRATVMPVISASGRLASSLFVFKGKRLPYRVVSLNGFKVFETYADHLPKGSMVSMREENGGVDGKKFYNWAHSFVNESKDLRQNRKKMLMIFDGYRSDMSLRVLELFNANGTIVYILPAHTSGKTQPLYFVLFHHSKLLSTTL